ncbi:bacillithiol system protein YtxJ [Fontibacillus phaseoli]|uniref:Bacillithiol system protein YtxJ n=1 Tax=Fontibacillus phaseoli TaxID=1416533 RepID=A0A369BPN6_9BACL|nr:bacillithiol system redox-active protein YtxJ [Fontibacillus phaseoli]RCX23025.1 bacillithiol system protein YtxJ [Fontibacillus phaseoli]
MSGLNRIVSKEDLHNALQHTAEQSLLLFKHSTSCPISARAHRELEEYLNATPNEKITYGLIYVIEDRDISNEAADVLGVKHESPQALLVKDGQAVWHTSHSRITADALRGILV